tara:strand:+ start:1256 stop:1648 length:393 start_codon:yes stop_codon:yes gene_type:complete
MKNQRSEEKEKLIKYRVNVENVFVTEETKNRLDYILGHHEYAARRLINGRLAENDLGGLDENLLSLVLSGVSVEQLTSELKNQVDPSGSAILEPLKNALSLIAIRHGQEACDQSVAHIESYLSSLKSEET